MRKNNYLKKGSEDKKTSCNAVESFFLFLLSLFQLAPDTCHSLVFIDPGMEK